MKVKVSHTLEVSEAQRRRIAELIDGEGSKKRDATREEMQEFIWFTGKNWELVLEPDEPQDDNGVSLGNIDVTHADVEEDLIGGDDEDLIGGDPDLSDLI